QTVYEPAYPTCGLGPAVFAVLCRAPAPPGISTLSLHAALPLSSSPERPARWARRTRPGRGVAAPSHTSGLPSQASASCASAARRSEEHTSELQSRENLVCRLLLEKENPTTGYSVGRPGHRQQLA